MVFSQKPYYLLMKAELMEITEEMAGDKELSEKLMKNFNAINDLVEKREKAIFSRLGEIKRDLIAELEASIDNWGTNLKADLESKMNAVFKKYGIDPDVIVES